MSKPYFEVRRSRIAGMGGFALRPIRKGARIIEYVGERISDDEADERYDDGASESHHTFLFSVAKNVNIDAAVDGNDSRFINHSCEPSCEAIEEDGRIFIHALRSIAVGEELSYDYRYERPGDPDPEFDRRYACRCGAATCRGSILAPAKKKRPKTARARAPKNDGRARA